jgi:hypothetical protein
MRLLETTTLEFVEFEIPPARYAILSHRWRRDEVSFKQYRKNREQIQHQAGYSKIVEFCAVARSRGFPFAWIDTCCIDKRSSAELSEAVNSMYQWYKSAHECFVWLDDYRPEDPSSLGECEWFTRGWTLQELLAPVCCIFFDADWDIIGHKHCKSLAGCRCGFDEFVAPRPCGPSILPMLETVTGISEKFLSKELPFSHASVAARMSWATGRTTTRVEDRAYSLLGLFDIHMPLLYGEREEAFQRLQEAIIRKSSDSSIFCRVAEVHYRFGLLALNPDCFIGCRDIAIGRPGHFAEPYAITNRGLRMYADASRYMLPCGDEYDFPNQRGYGSVYRIDLACQRSPHSDPQYLYLRNGFHGHVRCTISPEDQRKFRTAEWNHVGEKLFYISLS